MAVIFYCLVAYVIWYSFFKPKKTPIDISKNSDYYKKEFPDLFKNEPLLEEDKTPPPNITVNITNNITNNHLYLNSKS